MKLIVGLGNPGSRYVNTRHNAGRAVVEAIAQSRSLKLEKKKSLQAWTAVFDWEGVRAVLAVPDQFMNVSGEAARLLAAHFSIDLKNDFLAVVDDIALPFGKLRLRSRGSAGGHNGLKSFEAQLQTQSYARLRIGVGASNGEPLADYVLARFQKEELKAMPELLEKSGEACRLWVSQPADKAMNVVNSDK